MLGYANTGNVESLDEDENTTDLLTTLVLAGNIGETQHVANITESQLNLVVKNKRLSYVSVGTRA